MNQQITVTTTPDVILRHAIDLVTLPRPLGESFWEKQAAGLDELGYTIVKKDDAARWQAMEQRAREVYGEPPVHEHDHTARGTAVRILGYRP